MPYLKYSDVYEKICCHPRKEFLVRRAYNEILYYPDFLNVYSIRLDYTGKVTSYAYKLDQLVGKFCTLNTWNPYHPHKYKPTENDLHILDTTYTSSKTLAQTKYNEAGKSIRIKKMGNVLVDRKIAWCVLPEFEKIMDRKSSTEWNRWNRFKWLVQKYEVTDVYFGVGVYDMHWVKKEGVIFRSENVWGWTRILPYPVKMEVTEV